MTSAKSLFCIILMITITLLSAASGGNFLSFTINVIYTKLKVQSQHCTAFSSKIGHCAAKAYRAFLSLSREVWSFSER